MLFDLDGNRSVFVPALLVSTWLVFVAPVGAIEVPTTGPHPIATLDGATSVEAADFDRDGDLDAVGCAEGVDSGMIWWENTAGDASSWTPHAIGGAFDCRQVVVADLDGDLDPDLIGAASGVGQGGVTWWENDLSGSAAWVEHGIDTTFDGAVSVAAGDLDKDGDLDVVAGRGAGLTWWESDGSPTDGGWMAHAVTGASGVDGVLVADLDEDGSLDLATAGGSGTSSVVWWQSDGAALPGFTAFVVTTTFGDTHQLDTADVDRDGRPDLLVTSDGAGEIAWFDRTGPGLADWTERPVASGVPDSEWARFADLDQDGDLDVLGSGRSDGEIAWWENTGGASGWVERSLITGWGDARAVGAFDLDGDGDPDVLAAGVTADEIAWWNNGTPHRSLSFERAIEVDGFHRLSPIETQDLDNDGDLDFLAPVGISADPLRWSENDGTPRDGGWTEHLIATDQVGFNITRTADLDGDGDLDVVAVTSQPDAIYWFENDGTPKDGGWLQHTVESELTNPHFTEIVDLDGDHDLDLVVSPLAFGTVIVYENDGTPAVGEWPKRSLRPGNLDSRDHRLADLDGDGDLDVAVALSTFPDGLLWLENDGSAEDWPQREIEADFRFSEGMDLCDLDGDGDDDAIATRRGSGDAGEVHWFENDGTPGDGPWLQRTIDPAFAYARKVRCGDLDGDGDADVAANSFSSAGTVAVWLNDGTPADGGWQEIEITDRLVGTGDLGILDVDADGRVDVVAIAGIFGELFWWPGGGSQVALPALDTTPVVIAEGAVDDVLAVTVTHLGRAGDLAATLRFLELTFEESDRDPLTSGEANALIDALEIVRDDPSGPRPGDLDADDTLMATVDNLVLDGAGTLTVPLGDDQPSAVVAAGEPATVFVAVRLTDDATSQSPDTFQVSHAPSVPGIAEVTGFDIPLIVEPLVEVTSSNVQIDTDGDGDGVGDTVDNCPQDANGDQTDGDDDGAGAACDCDDGDAGAQVPDNCGVCGGDDTTCGIFADGFESGDSSAWTESIP